MGKSHFVLNRHEIRKLENLRRHAKKTNDHNLDKRARAILLIGRDGKTRPQAAQICESGLRTIYDWQEYYRLFGTKGLLILKKPGKQGRLKKGQLKKLSELIIAGPEAAGYETGIWTGPLVTSLIKREFGIEFSVHWVRIILHKLKFSIQYPKKNWQKQT